MIFQCHWELVKIPHTESGDPARAFYLDTEADNGDLTNENYRFIKKKYFYSIYITNYKDYKISIK